MNFIAPWYNVRKSIFSRWRLIPFSTWSFPEWKHASRIVAYRSGPTGFSRFLLRGGGRRGAACHSQNIARLGNLFFSSPLDPPSPRFRPTSLHLLCNYFPTRPRQHSSRLFSLLSNDHCAPRVEQKPGNEFGSFFLAHQPQLFSFNWIV